MTDVIRRATAADVDGINSARIASIVGLCATHYTREQLGVWAQPVEPERLRAYIEAQAYWVATREGTIEGFGNLILEPEHPGIGFVRGLYLTPAVKGQGLGKLVLAAIERHGVQHGRTRLQLKATLNAVAFYEAQGFRRTGPEAASLRLGVPLPHVPMEKMLS